MATLSGKAVLVIGGSSGIGHEIARQARAEGAELTITGRDAQRLALAAEDLGGLEAIQLDAHDETALNHFLTERPPVDHMVSMVGDSMAGGFLSTTPETMRHVLHSKFWTNWMVGRHAPGALVAGGSLTLGALVEGLAYELAPDRRVNAVAPTFMGARTRFWSDVPPDELVNAVAPTFMGARTRFWSDVPTEELDKQQAGFSQRVPLQRLGTVAEVASTYIHLMTNTFINGQVLSVDGGVMLDK